MFIGRGFSGEFRGNDLALGEISEIIRFAPV
jgi:hypothetical protein